MFQAASASRPRPTPAPLLQCCPGSWIFSISISHWTRNPTLWTQYYSASAIHLYSIAAANTRNLDVAPAIALHVSSDPRRGKCPWHDFPPFDRRLQVNSDRFLGDEAECEITLVVIASHVYGRRNRDLTSSRQW
jgi:hypothetical protein